MEVRTKRAYGRVLRYPVDMNLAQAIRLLRRTALNLPVTITDDDIEALSILGIEVKEAQP